MLDSLTASLTGLSPFWFFSALFLFAYLENIIPPIPGDTVTVFAAYLVGRTGRGFFTVWLATSAGSVAGFMTYYAIGRFIHPEYFIRRNFRLLPAASIEKAGKWFARYGYWIVLLNRFLSGIRSVISIVCGLFRLPWPRVLFLAAAGSAVWNLMLIWAGYLLGANWRVIEGILTQYSRFLFAAGIAAALWWIWRRRGSGRRRPA